MCDFWNCLDFFSVVGNVFLIGSFSICLVLENEIISIEFVRSAGAFSSFLMWIKVFYWMRLFPSLAYYVKLITDTLFDSFSFLFMVILIIMSFSSYFYIVNENTDKDTHYFGDYFFKDKGEPDDIADVVVSTYMLGALGSFESSIYAKGYNHTQAMNMFVLATFVIQVIFMNMLICIMGNTFSIVQENSEASGLKE